MKEKEKCTVFSHWSDCVSMLRNSLLRFPSAKEGGIGDGSLTYNWGLILSMLELRDRRVPCHRQGLPSPPEGEQCPCRPSTPTEPSLRLPNHQLHRFRFLPETGPLVTVLLG